MNDQPSPAAALEKPRAVWIGVDVAKATFEAAMITPAQKDAELRDLPARSFPRTRDGVVALLAWADEVHPDADCRAVMEVTGKYSTELAAWLAELRPSLEPAVVPPTLIKGHGQSLHVRNKTDRLDARLIAHFGLERAPAARQGPSKIQQQLQALVRERDALVQDRAAHRMRVDEGSPSAVVTRLQAGLLRTLDAAVAKLDKAIAGLIAKDARMSADLRVLDSIPGVARVSASIILAELGDLRRFNRARQLAAFAGLSPEIKESGKWKGRTRLCKKGSPYARRTLYLCALAAIRGDNVLGRFHRQLVARGKARMAAVGAVMRKLVLLMRALVISGKPFDDAFASSLLPCAQLAKACGQTEAACGQNPQSTP